MGKINPLHQTKQMDPDSVNKPFLFSVVIFLLTALSVAAINSRGEPKVSETNLEKLPMEIAGFKGTEDYFSKAVYEELNADKHVYRHYRSGDGRRVDLYIGYYGTAKGGRTSHDPYGCLPGAGWGILESKQVALTAEGFPNDVKINSILSKKGAIYELKLHWYQSDKDKILATGIGQNIRRFIGRVFHNRNDGAFVQVSAFSDQGHIEETKRLVESFAGNILHLLPKYWPVEK
ncbi:MAG: EpsI family protein [Desulfobacterales bacterium]|nr:EpsI family protein [Desulfobacterales bacterium]